MADKDLMIVFRAINSDLREARQLYKKKEFKACLKILSFTKDYTLKELIEQIRSKTK